MKYDIDTLLILGFGGGFALIVLVALGIAFRKRIRFSLRSLLLLTLCAGSVGLLLVELFPYNPALSRVPFSGFPAPKLSPDGRYLAISESLHHNPVIVDLKEGGACATLVGDYNDFCFAPDGRTLLLETWKNIDTVTVWEFESSKTHILRAQYQNEVVSSGDARVLTMVRNGEAPSEVRLYALDGTLVASHTFDGQVYDSSVTLSSDAKVAAIVSLDPRLYIWRPQSAESPKVFPLEHGVRKAVLSPDGSKVLTIDPTGVLCLRDVGTGAMIHRWVNVQDDIVRVRFLDNEGRIVTSGQGVQVWDGKTGQLLAELLSKDVSCITDVRWLDASQELAVVCQSHGIYYWKWSRFPHGSSYFHLTGFWLSCATLLACVVSIVLDRRRPATPQGPALGLRPARTEGITCQ